MQNERHEITSSPQPIYFATPPDTDEISLIDLWLILVRRRWWFLGTLAVVMGAVIAFLVLTRPLYESRATLQIGQIANINGSGQTTPLELPDVLVSKLQAQYHLNDKDTAPIRPPKVTDVSSNSGNSLITITARAYNSKKAQSFLKNTLQKIQNRQQKLFDQAMSARKDYLVNLKQQKKQLQSQVDSISQQLAKDKGIGPSTTSILTTDRAGLLQQISTIQTQITDVKQSMNPPQSQPTELLQEPTLPVKRIFPKTKLTIALGLAGGVLLGLLVAFFVEFLHRVQMETKKRCTE